MSQKNIKVDDWGNTRRWKLDTERRLISPLVGLLLMLFKAYRFQMVLLVCHAGSILVIWEWYQHIVRNFGSY